MATTYGEWLSEQRDRAGITAEELAERSWCCTYEIIAFENCEDFPLPELRQRIEDALQYFLRSKDSSVLPFDYAEDPTPELRREFRKLSVEGKHKVLAFIRAMNGVPRYWRN